MTVEPLDTDNDAGEYPELVMLIFEVVAVLL